MKPSMGQRFLDIMVDIAKLRDYCLSEFHLRGRHKARVFRSRLGLAAADAEMLRDAILGAVRGREDRLIATDADAYGQRYLLDFEMRTSLETAIVRTTWIVLEGQHVLRLTSCYVL